MLVGETCAETPIQEKRVREVVQSFYDAFNSRGWTHAADYTTDDWNHINPGGGWTRGRTAVLKELKEVDSTFLRGVSDRIEEMTVRFASADVGSLRWSAG
jgi:ketosteroid isomerase-like protein